MGDAWPLLGRCCCRRSALQFLLLPLLRDGGWGCGVGGWLRIEGLEIKSSSMKACMSVAYEEVTEGGLRTTKSSDRGENKALSLSESDETLQTISSSSELENVEIWLPLGGESNSKDWVESREGLRTICVGKEELIIKAIASHGVERKCSGKGEGRGDGNGGEIKVSDPILYSSPIKLIANKQHLSYSQQPLFAQPLPCSSKHYLQDPSL